MKSKDWYKCILSQNMTHRLDKGTKEYVQKNNITERINPEFDHLNCARLIRQKYFIPQIRSSLFVLKTIYTQPKRDYIVARKHPQKYVEVVNYQTIMGTFSCAS